MWILITGGAGFIGKALVRRMLARGDWMLVGQKAMPDKLLARGFAFRFPRLADASRNAGVN